MRDWRRMCNKMREQGDWCQIDKCPLAGKCQLPSTTDIALVERIVMQWAAEHPEPVYPTWEQFIAEMYLRSGRTKYHNIKEWEINEHIPADIAEKLGIDPKEGLQ